MVTEFSNLAIVNNAVRDANGSGQSVASSRGNAAMVTGVPFPPSQVTADGGNSIKVQHMGVKRKVKPSATIANYPV